MICPKCGSELETIYPDGIGQFGCPICKLAENELLPIALEKLAKAEGELKAIKARIEAVTEETIKQKIYDNAYKGIDNNDEAIWCFDNYDFNAFLKNILEIIKQIGGEK